MAASGKALTLGGDGRADAPGHSAKVMKLKAAIIWKKKVLCEALTSSTTKESKLNRL